jgi:hypothetical protein
MKYHALPVGVEAFAFAIGVAGETEDPEGRVGLVVFADRTRLAVVE